MYIKLITIIYTYLGELTGKFPTGIGHEDSERGEEVQLYTFLNLGVRLGWVVTPRPGRFTPGKKI